ncbi:MAG TPA: hypothetical protein VEH76_07430 [Methylocystis sp.]|nr:hypothetical protein [Methylocystis sp.]
MPSSNHTGIVGTISGSRHARRVLASAFVLAASCAAARADGVSAAGVLFEPPSNAAEAADEGVAVHTFIKMMKPQFGAKNVATRAAAGLPPYSGYGIETPGSLQCIYGFQSSGATACNPNQVVPLTSLGSNSSTIAIVDAYDYPAAAADLAAFSAQFGLPAPTSANFSVVYASGSKPANGSGSGWDIEAALDIEYAHAMAPNAKIILVEAKSASFADLFTAVQVAAGYVAAAKNGGQVSMSWGGAEFSYEASYDSVFSGNHVVFYAAAGDNPGTIYPCVSPNVVCVGGTSNRRGGAANNFAFEGQFAWSSTGGGPSLYEALPTFQSTSSAASVIGSMRGAPDVAALADPNNGVWVYNTTYERGAQWWQVGGTSAATPITAGLDNAAGNFALNSAAYLGVLYHYSGAERTLVTSGYCGFNYAYAAGSSWSFCTGYGVPRPLNGLAQL